MIENLYGSTASYVGVCVYCSWRGPERQLLVERGRGAGKAERAKDKAKVDAVEHLKDCRERPGALAEGLEARAVRREEQARKDAEAGDIPF